MDFMTMICDIKNSKRISNREEVQYRLIDTLKEANRTFHASLACPFIITLGDEWQGLFKYPSNYTEVIDFFRSRLKEVEFYCGIGIGEVSIHDFELTVNQLDGPSFHNARQAVKLAKEFGKSLVLIK